MGNSSAGAKAAWAVVAFVALSDVSVSYAVESVERYSVASSEAKDAVLVKLDSAAEAVAFHDEQSMLERAVPIRWS